VVSDPVTVPAPHGTTRGIYAYAGKRALDVVLALTALLVFAPLLILIGLLIVVTDPGPVIFSQQRVGRQGQVFRFFKFRSMPVGTKSLPSDQIGQIKLTWFGKLLRRSNLDELPQLINILRGDMSIVGPRPPIPSQVELIELRAANEALACRPGLTGLAQVSSFNGMTVAQKARYDAEYAANISLLGDLRIILRTFSYLTRPPPVY
jgi:O-antigen biosynthesis protein WbqP